MAFPGRRASAVRWISTADAGDAAEVSAEIEDWLARRPPAADWEGVLGALRDGLLRLSLDPRAARDPAIAAILADIAADPEDPEALDAALGTLLDRLSASAGAPPEPDRGRGPPEEDGPGPGRARMIFRL